MLRGWRGGGISYFLNPYLFYLKLIQWRLPELITAWRGGHAAGGGEETTGSA